ncbi:MAG TPA: flagellar biosynthesis repressor FlbT [Thiobacillaceae bacterium]|nr:flagellar biosynthesis repressor FlbT [Thiobacillaceae bacterium]HNU65122.1 flagellar biosynthesis repressor FlbT [Thiobacillaceae bacterium]
MPLQLDLRPHEKLFIGGAVVVNGDSRGTLTILNDVPILREKDILTEDGADTPCKRIYLAIQLMYMAPQELTRYHQLYWSLIREVLAAAPSTRELITAISEAVLAARYYPALKLASELIRYEKELVTHAGQST